MEWFWNMKMPKRSKKEKEMSCRQLEEGLRNEMQAGGRRMRREGEIEEFHEDNCKKNGRMRGE